MSFASFPVSTTVLLDHSSAGHQGAKARAGLDAFLRVGLAVFCKGVSGTLETATLNAQCQNSLESQKGTISEGFAVV